MNYLNLLLLLTKSFGMLSNLERSVQVNEINIGCIIF